LGKKLKGKSKAELSGGRAVIRRELPSLIISLAMATLVAAGFGGIDGVSEAIQVLAAVFMFLCSWLTLRFRSVNVAESESDENKDELFVSVIVPVFNEEPELLRRGLESISSQTRRPDRVWVIDDGSSVLDCARRARQWATEQSDDGIDVHVVVLPQNSGKRRALIEAFENDSDADIFFTIDSDTILDAQAIEQGLLPFRSPQVFAVAGVLFGHNRDQNLLTRLVEMEFVCGFLVNRAAMSKFDSVLVTCGSLAAYRADICREHVKDLLDETFLGAPVLNGDDRKLTQFALQKGKTRLQETCTGRVALPQSLSHLFRQRTRWSTSFYRGTLFMLRTMPMNRAAFWLTLSHAGIFCLQTLVLLGVIIFGSTIGWLNLAIIMAAIAGPGIVVRHGRYWDSPGIDRSTVSMLEFLTLSPLSSLMSVLVLIPARYYALFHLRSNQWGTRRVVETVTLRPESNGGNSAGRKST